MIVINAYELNDRGNFSFTLSLSQLFFFFFCSVVMVGGSSSGLGWHFCQVLYEQRTERLLIWIWF